jgi:hypothetical protein
MPGVPCFIVAVSSPLLVVAVHIDKFSEYGMDDLSKVADWFSEAEGNDNPQSQCLLESPKFVLTANSIVWLPFGSAHST